MGPGEAGPGQGDGSSTSSEIQNRVFRALPPAQAKGDGEWQMQRVLSLDQAQEEGLKKKDSAERKWVQKRKAVPIPVELKAWRSDLRFLANTFIRPFLERDMRTPILAFVSPCWEAGLEEWPVCSGLWSPHGGLSTHTTLVSCTSS